MHLVLRSSAHDLNLAPVVGGRHPIMELTGDDIAPANDRCNTPACKSIVILKQRGDAQRGRRLNHQSGVFIKQAHACNDAIFADEHHVIANLQEVVEHLRDWAATGNAIGDGVDGLGLCPIWDGVWTMTEK